MVFPVIPNMVFALPSRFHIAGHNKPAVANQTPWSKSTELGPGVPLVMADFGTANSVGFSIVSPSGPSDQQDISAPNATISKRSLTGPIVTGVTLGKIIVPCLGVLLLLLLLIYLKRRRRNLQSTRPDDVENGVSRQARQAEYEPGGDSFLPIGHPTSSFAPSISQASSQTAVPVSLPTASSLQATDEGKGKARFQIPPRPPPLLLRPVHADWSARQGGPIITRSKAIIRRREVDNQVSSLPNPWDGGARPRPTTVKSVTFLLPPSTSPLRPTMFFKAKAGLPQNPREARTFPMRSSSLFTVDHRLSVEHHQRQRPAPI
ncbi:hypothetical protein BJV74DRAFT_849238 [Russula compacta]|nr:hypothetical protein BJV74DRAFT_849238 [Russula compacta]